MKHFSINKNPINNLKLRKKKIIRKLSAVGMTMRKQQCYCLFSFSKTVFSEKNRPILYI